MANKTALTSFAKDPQTPVIQRPSEVIYQVYPSSFADSNNDGCGDLPGITERLDYIKKLGVDSVWISPFFLSPPGPEGDGGYAVTDYRKIAPRFGDMADFQKLLKEAHDKGLKIYIDFVLAHTAQDHDWFEKSRRREDPYTDYYVWHDGYKDASGKRQPPNNWKSVFGGQAWTWDDQRGQWYMHHFLKSQPALNLNLPKVQDAILDEMKFWLDMGVDGFRLDALPFANHDPLLRNNPWLDGKWPRASEQWNEQRFEYSICQPQTVELSHRIRKLMDSYPEKRTSLAEVLSGVEGGAGSIPVAASYVGPKDGLDICYTESLVGIFEYPGQTRLKKLITDVLDHFPSCGGHCNSADNHDTPRSASRMLAHVPPSNKSQVLRQLAQLFICLPGSFCLYQGQELGLPQARIPEDIPFKDLKDLGNNNNRDGCRTPIPWEASAKNAGFSTSDTPYLPVPKSHQRLAVDKQEATPDSMLNFTRALLAWRKSQPALCEGQTIVIDNPGDVLAMIRTSKDQTMLCLFNMSGREQIFKPSDFMDAGLLQKLNLKIGDTISVDAYGTSFQGARPTATAHLTPAAGPQRIIKNNPISPAP